MSNSGGAEFASCHSPFSATLSFLTQDATSVLLLFLKSLVHDPADVNDLWHALGSFGVNDGRCGLVQLGGNLAHIHCVLGSHIHRFADVAMAFPRNFVQMHA